MKKLEETSKAMKAAFQEAVRDAYPVAHGTLALVRKPCANPNCTLCKSGKRHPAWTFTYRKGNKLHCMHVQPKHVETMRKAIENGRRLEEVILDEGVALLRRLRGEE